MLFISNIILNFLFILLFVFKYKKMDFLNPFIIFFIITNLYNFAGLYNSKYILLSTNLETELYLYTSFFFSNFFFY